MKFDRAALFELIKWLAEMDARAFLAEQERPQPPAEPKRTGGTVVETEGKKE